MRRNDEKRGGMGRNEGGMRDMMIIYEYLHMKIYKVSPLLLMTSKLSVV